MHVGRWCTILGVIVSIGTAYLVTHFKSIMDYMQALVSFFIAPLFGTVILGMLWKRATAKGGFWGLLAGTSLPSPCTPRSSSGPSGFATLRCLAGCQAHGRKSLSRALVMVNLRRSVTIVVSLFTKSKTASELQGLVRAYTVIPSDRDGPCTSDLSSGQWALRSFRHIANRVLVRSGDGG